MIPIEIQTSQLGKLLFSAPSEGGRLNKSYLNYHFGITEWDEKLEGKSLNDLKVEFGIQIYANHIVFILYREKEALWGFPLCLNSISEIKAIHEQDLNIRKDSFLSGHSLKVMGNFGFVGGVLAGTIDALTGNSKIPKDQLVLGSIFELYVKATGEQDEKIVMSCTNKNKVIVERFFDKIIDKIKSD